jgi:hypothetical protein
MKKTLQIAATILTAGHGGKRQSSGRKPIDRTGMQKVTVWLTNDDVKIAENIGIDGKIDSGIKMALRSSIF